MSTKLDIGMYTIYKPVLRFIFCRSSVVVICCECVDLSHPFFYISLEWCRDWCVIEVLMFILVLQFIFKLFSVNTILLDWILQKIIQYKDFIRYLKLINNNNFKPIYKIFLLFEKIYRISFARLQRTIAFLAILCNSSILPFSHLD